jgi:signal transduction histidine kinase
MRGSGRLEDRVKRWAYAGAIVMILATAVCLGLLLLAWRGQVRQIQSEMDTYTRAEGLAVARLVLYDLASNPNVLRAHLLEDNLLDMGPAPRSIRKERPAEELLDLVNSNVELPDTRIWMLARQKGWDASLDQIVQARRVLYEQTLQRVLQSIKEDLSARVTFSDHLRGLMLRSSGELATIQVGERGFPPPGELKGHTTLVLSASRMVVVLPLYVQTRRWGTAYFLMDRSVLARVTEKLTGTLNWGLWGLAGLFMLFLASWAVWWRSLLKSLRRDVVAPVVSLARRMESWSQEVPPDRPEMGEPQWLAGAFDRLLVRVEDQQEQLLRAQRLGLMERMGAGLSHELNNALNPAVLRLDEVAMEGRPPTREDLKALREYLLSAKKILKELSLAGRNEAEPSRTLVPTDWLFVAKRLVEHQFREGGVNLHWVVDENAPTVYGEEQGLVQVAVNLLINALDAAASGTGEGNVRVSLEERDRSAVLTIRDDGPGIPDDLRDKVLEPFVTTKAQGTGLGLYLVDVFLRRMNGSLRMGQAQDGGTVAEVVLPLPPGKGAARNVTR